MLSLSDTHCHIDLEPYDSDRQTVLERAWQSGLQRILIPSIDLASCQTVLDLSRADERIWAAVGVHPNSGRNWSDEALSELRALAGDSRVCAIGEIGLDYYRDHTPQDVQRKILIDQLALAIELDKPVILHCRDAFDDLFHILVEWQTHLPTSARQIQRFPGVFHSFGGDLDQATRVIQAGFYLGINGSITFKNAARICEVVRSVDPAHLLLETDAPYITPVPHRGKRNEPAHIVIINAKLAELTGLSPDQCAKITYNNACNLFNW